MNEAYKLVGEGLNGNNIEQALRILSEQKDKNLIVWFVVHQILERINLEWEDEILPIERVEYLNKTFRPDLLFLIKNINTTDLNAVTIGLTEIVKKYIYEYTSFSYQS